MDQLLANLPFALLFLVCPLMMLFVHRGGGHDRHAAMHERHDPGARTDVAVRPDRSTDRAER